LFRLVKVAAMHYGNLLSISTTETSPLTAHHVNKTVN